MENKKIIVFGAGKIGRSFIGQVFYSADYEVVFIDINETLINLINKKKEYRIIFKEDDKERSLYIRNIRGVYLGDEKHVIDELLNADLISLSVGQQGLKTTIPIIAKALIVRQKKFGMLPLDVIIAENMRNSDSFLRSEFGKYLPVDYPFDSLVGLVETSIGKMVPIMTQKDIEEDPLLIFAEPYNSLIVAKKGFKNPIPNSPFLAPKVNIKAWVDRKLFIHNMGHAAVAYLGFQSYPEATYIYEILEIKPIFEEVRETMLQSADILQSLYPEEFTQQQLEIHIDDLLSRFKNKSLGDTIFRVGCDLYRKLEPEDRLVGPVNAAIKTGKPYHLILNVIKAAICFKAKDENDNYFPADLLFFVEAKKGFPHILENICNLPVHAINSILAHGD